MEKVRGQPGDKSRWEVFIPTQSVSGQVQVQAGSRPRVCSVGKVDVLYVGGRGRETTEEGLFCRTDDPRAFFLSG